MEAATSVPDEGYFRDEGISLGSLHNLQSLKTTIRYTTRAGIPFEFPGGVCMLHVSGQATYHRGQLNSIIKLAGGTPSRVMLILFARE
jgi:uncharacterized damage-inducible protein DinB